MRPIPISGAQHFNMMGILSMTANANANTNSSKSSQNHANTNANANAGGAYVGTHEDDVIVASNGRDTLIGKKGDDTLDISDLLHGNYTSIDQAIADYVRFTSNGDSTSTLEVNANGQGNDFVAVAHVNVDLSGVDLDDLITDGSVQVL